jgi:hypothetical protein
VDSQSQSDRYQQHIIELEAKLSLANEAIEELREQNDRLQEANSNRVSKDSFKKLSQLQFLSIVTGVSLAIAIVGFTLIRLFTQQSAAPQKTKLQPPGLSSLLSAPSTSASNESVSPGLRFSVPQNQLIPQEKQATQQRSLELAYNVRQSAKLRYAGDLQAIVDEAVSLVDQQGLPIKPLSITLIDLKSYTFAGYEEQVPRFPASVSKLFWMVELYAQLKKEALPDQSTFYPDLYKMIQKSDNESASRVVDWLTSTTSGLSLEDEAFNIWLQKRKQLSKFFEVAGYEGIDISQKNFPIPYLKLDLPKGRDLQMRGNLSRPIRNQVTTKQAARLMSEIVAGEAVSQQASQEMLQLLTRDLQPEIWKQEKYNSIEGFLGESLPLDNAYLASKVGWTFDSRQEVAYIRSKDAKATYILVIFADSPAYGNDWKIFPKISRLVFDRMVTRS